MIALDQERITSFFHALLRDLLEQAGSYKEKWYELIEFQDRFELSAREVKELMMHFTFILRRKGNYTSYIAIDKVQFVIEARSLLDKEFRELAEILNFTEFERLICRILDENGYYTLTNFRFADATQLKEHTSQERYEIDVIGLYRHYLLIIDAKQWSRRDVFSTMNKAANLQYQRVIALYNNPEVLKELIETLTQGKKRLKDVLPLTLLPMMATLEDNGIRLNDCQVPLVACDKLNSFLREFEKYLYYFQNLRVKSSE